MFSDIGFSGFVLLAIVALLLFGPKRLPELGRALGRTVREFKSGMKDIMEDQDRNEEPARKAELQQSAPVSKQLPE